MALLAFALVVAAVGIGKLAVLDRGVDHADAPAPGGVAAPPPSTAAPTTGPTTTTTTEPPAPPTEPPTTAVAASADQVGAGGGPGEATAGTSPVAGPAPAGAVACHPDVPLAEAPDAPYAFECTQGDVPVAWASPAVTVYRSGLSGLQELALPLALAQWQLVAGFTWSFVDTPDAADVVIHQAALPSAENGYTTVHYTCAPRCAYDHAEVQLSSSAPLLESTWIPTILHELGHVAGLNHVARSSQVMYPSIGATTLPAYAPGDAAGLQELARIRDS